MNGRGVKKTKGPEKNRPSANRLNSQQERDSFSQTESFFWGFSKAPPLIRPRIKTLSSSSKNVNNRILRTTSTSTHQFVYKFIRSVPVVSEQKYYCYYLLNS